MFPSFLRAVYTDSLDHDAKNEKGVNQKFDHPAWSGLSSTPLGKYQSFKTLFISSKGCFHTCPVWFGQVKLTLVCPLGADHLKTTIALRCAPKQEVKRWAWSNYKRTLVRLFLVRTCFDLNLNHYLGKSCRRAQMSWGAQTFACHCKLA